MKKINYIRKVKTGSAAQGHFSKGDYIKTTTSYLAHTTDGGQHVISRDNILSMIVEVGGSVVKNITSMGLELLKGYFLKDSQIVESFNNNKKSRK